MRHDAKLGLALGMLVIGFAVAFCFPRQSTVPAWRTPEVPAPIADAGLEFLPIRAYQPTPADAAHAKSTAALEPSMPVNSDSPSAESVAADDRPAPEPIAPVVVENPSADQEEASVATSEQTETPPKELPPELQPYRVQPGDTLSAIAARRLGSTARYLELYEANRDILTSPDALKIGMELRMPGAPLPESVAESLAESTEKPVGGESAEKSQNGAASAPTGGKQPPKAPWVAERPQTRQ